MYKLRFKRKDKFFASLTNPESVQQYRLWQLKTYGKHTTQYVPGTL